MRNSEGSILVRLSAKNPISGRLLVMRESLKTPGAVDWIQIGTVDSSVVMLVGPQVEQIAGRPVFLCP